MLVPPLQNPENPGRQFKFALPTHQGMTVNTAPTPVPTARTGTVPLTPSRVNVTQDQFLSWTNLQNHVQLQSAVAARLAVKPRIGGISAVGIWTGYGENEEGLNPTSDMAFRAFFTTVMKAHTHLGVIDQACRAGLSSITGASFFSQSHEADGSKIIPCLQALKNFLVNHGMEGVFTIVQRGAKDIRMLVTPGHIDEDMVKDWVRDLTVQGVYGPITRTRLPVCPYGVKNLGLSGKAILSSCYPALEEAIE